MTLTSVNTPCQILYICREGYSEVTMKGCIIALIAFTIYSLAEEGEGLRVEET